MSTPNKPPPRSTGPYVSGGHVLQSPPLSARINRLVEDLYFFFGLYLVSLFSLDPYSAAENSRFNLNKPQNRHNQRPRWGGDSGYGKGGGGGGGGSGGWGPGGGGGSGGSGPSRKIGRVDDIRGPECGSCQ